MHSPSTPWPSSQETDLAVELLKAGLPGELLVVLVVPPRHVDRREAHLLSHHHSHHPNEIVTVTIPYISLQAGESVGVWCCCLTHLSAPLGARALSEETAGGGAVVVVRRGVVVVVHAAWTTGRQDQMTGLTRSEGGGYLVRRDRQLV